jgi:hypothetical protein
MANHPITITGIADNKLVLSDNGHTFVNPGDTVTWIVGNNSGVSSITAITDNVTVDVFSPDPSKVGNSNNWQGTVNPNIAKGSVETYTIGYTTGNQSCSFDPKIEVNP